MNDLKTGISTPPTVGTAAREAVEAILRSPQQRDTQIGISTDQFDQIMKKSRPNPALEKLAEQTLTRLESANSDYGRQRILNGFVAKLNRCDGFLTSYPAQPNFIYSTNDLLKLKVSLSSQRNEAQTAGQTQKVEQFRAMLDAVEIALQERDKSFDESLPFKPIPLFELAF